MCDGERNPPIPADKPPTATTQCGPGPRGCAAFRRLSGCNRKCGPFFKCFDRLIISFLSNTTFGWFFYTKKTRKPVFFSILFELQFLWCTVQSISGFFYDEPTLTSHVYPPCCPRHFGFINWYFLTQMGYIFPPCIEIHI